MGPFLSLSQWYPPQPGGAFLWLHEVNRRLDRAVVLTDQVEGLPVDDVVDGVVVRRLHLKRHTFLRPKSALLYANLMRQGLRAAQHLRPSVIMAARVMPEGLAAVLVGRTAGVPVVILAHGEEIGIWGSRPIRGGVRRGRSRAKRSLFWWTYREAAHVVANSRNTARLLCDGGVRDHRISVIHPGTDPQRFLPREPDRHLRKKYCPDGSRVLLSVGRLVKRKGHDTVIRALRRINEAAPGTRYLVAGSGPYEQPLRRLADTLGVNALVTFLGQVDQDDLPGLYNLADVFVMPGREVPETGDFEGFGIVFLEAGASGTPVVAGRAGGMPEAVLQDETGLVVDGNSPAALTAAVVRLLRDHDLARRLGKAARLRIAEKLTWEHSAEQVRMVLERLTGGSAAGHLSASRPPALRRPGSSPGGWAG